MSGDEKSVEVRLTREELSHGRDRVVLSLVNRGARPQVFNLAHRVGDARDGKLPQSPLPGQVQEWHLALRDAAGKRLEMSRDVKPLPVLRTHFRELAPDEASEVAVDLGSLYPLQPGAAYTLQVAYVNSDDGRRFGVQAWCGVSTSDELPVTIPQN